MEHIYIVGGMGAGKSSVTKALASIGLPVVDMDKIGHLILARSDVKRELRIGFGPSVFDEKGSVIRKELARKAFQTPESTKMLNRITQPRIMEECERRMDALEKEGAVACVVECSAFKSRDDEFVKPADTIIAVTAPMDERIERAVAAGFTEQDVRQRISRQISDADRAALSDIVLENNSTREALAKKTIAWWNEHSKAKQSA